MEIITRPLYKCDVCGNTEHWSKGWSAYLCAFGSGYSGYEEEFHVCSNECEAKLLTMTKKERLKLLQGS
jgi:hypothetical protein